MALVVVNGIKASSGYQAFPLIHLTRGASTSKKQMEVPKKLLLVKGDKAVESV